MNLYWGVLTAVLVVNICQWRDIFFYGSFVTKISKTSHCGQEMDFQSGNNVESSFDKSRIVQTHRFP